MGKFTAYVRDQIKKSKKIERQRRVEEAIGGKDYLTQAEAAAYCCVSLRQFTSKAPEVGLFPFKFMGKLVYRKEDLQKAMEDARWQQST